MLANLATGRSLAPAFSCTKAERSSYKQKLASKTKHCRHTHTMMPHALLLPPLMMVLVASSTVLVASATTTTTSLTTTTTMYYAPHVMFNEGQLDPSMHCSSAEWNLITDALMTNNDSNNDNDDRRLQDATSAFTTPQPITTPQHSSAYILAPTAHTHDNDTHHHRSLYRRCGCSLCIFAGVGCAGQATRRRSLRLRTLNGGRCPLDKVSTVLDTIATLLSTSLCAALLNAPRTLTCRPVVDCAISQVNVWDVLSNAMCTKIIHSFMAPHCVPIKSSRFKRPPTLTWVRCNSPCASSKIVPVLPKPLTEYVESLLQIVMHAKMNGIGPRLSV
jgi:hypothetical protein